MTKTKKKKQRLDVCVGGFGEDEFSLGICQYNGITLEINDLCKADMLELQSAINCALLPSPEKKAKKK